MKYIVIKNYYKIIKGSHVLNNINLELDKGQIYGFIGRNGSGKTMLFRAICGLIKPTTGEVFVDNYSISKDIDFPKSCGVIIETPGFWDELTGFECLKILAGIKKIINDDEICNWMNRFNLNPKDKRTYKKYSLGMKQKLALAQAFMENPDLIILDEPTNSLDETSVLDLRNIIIEQKKRGATILLASHHKEDIEILCDKIFRIDNGQLLE